VLNHHRIVAFCDGVVGVFVCRSYCRMIPCDRTVMTVTWFFFVTCFPSRFQLNVTAGSQKRAIANLRKSEGRDESRFALRLKRNLDFKRKSRSLSILCHYWDKHCHYWDNQNVWAFSRCVENDSQLTLLKVMALGATNEKLWRERNVCSFVFNPLSTRRTLRRQFDCFSR
jgi:hypothetical protein